MIFLPFFSAAQENETHTFMVSFDINGSELDREYADNARQIEEAVNFLNRTKEDPDVEIVNVTFWGTSSPDGPTERNRELAYTRLKELERAVRSRVQLPEIPITYDSNRIGWEWLRSEIVASDINAKDEVLELIDMTPVMVDFPGGRTIDCRVVELREHNGGSTWKVLSSKYFNRMRLAGAQITTRRVVHPQPVLESPAIFTPEEETVVREEVFVQSEVLSTAKEKPDWYHKMYFKTNIPAWGLLWQNLAVEFDLARHWSLAIPVYWSPYDYGKPTLKFRILAVVPEIRWWPRYDNTGFFLNIHGGGAYYNVALGGEHRYQNHDSKTPAYGGGIGVGYRFYFCRNHHWAMEVALGGGAYKLVYDIYRNTSPTRSGDIIGRRTRMFYCVDQAAFSISYSFGLRK